MSMPHEHHHHGGLTFQQLENVFRELQHIHFELGAKKPEWLLWRLKHALRHIPKPIRLRMLEHILTTGEVRLPAIEVEEVQVNLPALEKAVETFINSLPPGERKAYEDILKKIAELKTEYRNMEEFRRALREILGELANKTVLNLSEFFSSLSSYLAEQGLNKNQINNIIREIEREVFGGASEYYVVNSPAQLQEIMQKIQKVLEKYHIPVYNVVWKLMPIATRVTLINPEKAARLVLEKLFGRELGQKLYNMLQGYFRGKEMPLEEFLEHFTNILNRIVVSGRINTWPTIAPKVYRAYEELWKEAENKGLVVGNEWRGFAIQFTRNLGFWALLALENILEKVAKEGGFRSNVEFVKLLKKYLPRNWKVEYKGGYHKFGSLYASGELIIETPWHAKIVIHMRNANPYDLKRLLEKLRKYTGEIRKYLHENWLETWKESPHLVEEANLKLFELFKKQGVAGTPEHLIMHILEQAIKKNELPHRVERWVEYQRVATIKIPTFMEVLSKEAEQYEMKAAQILARLREWLSKEMGAIVRPVYRMTYVTWRIV